MHIYEWIFKRNLSAQTNFPPESWPLIEIKPMTVRGLRLKILIKFLNFSFNLTETFGTFEGIIFVALKY